MMETNTFMTGFHYYFRKLFFSLVLEGNTTCFSPASFHLNDLAGHVLLGPASAPANHFQLLKTLGQLFHGRPTVGGNGGT